MSTANKEFCFSFSEAVEAFSFLKVSLIWKADLTYNASSKMSKSISYSEVLAGHLVEQSLSMLFRYSKMPVDLKPLWMFLMFFSKNLALC